jgi:hypothetical protein
VLFPFPFPLSFSPTVLGRLFAYEMEDTTGTRQLARRISEYGKEGGYWYHFATVVVFTNSQADDRRALIVSVTSCNEGPDKAKSKEK